MSFEMTKVSNTGASIETIQIKLPASSNTEEKSLLNKIYVINNKDYNLNICALIEGVSENVRIGQLADAIDYEYIKNKPLSGNEGINFDILICGKWKGDSYGLDLEVLYEERLVLNNDTKKNVRTLSKQLLSSIKSTFKRTFEKELIFCLDCGCKLNNKGALMDHITEFHECNLLNKNAINNCSDALLIHLERVSSKECKLMTFKRADWLEHWSENLIPFLVSSDQMQEANSHSDTDTTQSPSQLSILPSWTTATSPCTIICNVCDTSFSSPNELEEHTRVNHLRSTSPSSRTSNRHCSNREYRCNICNYKTITKGNLHIHFQSEKHRNNQREHDQNEQKRRVHNQEPSSIQSMSSISQLHLFDSLLSRSNHFFTNMKTTPYPNNWSSNSLSAHNLGTSLSEVKTEPSTLASFECDICHNFSSHDTDSILEHAERPRALPNNSEVSKVVRVGMDGAQGTELEHLCLLDGYKTRIKANFLLHFKTEKHQQKLQLLAHAREGRMENANKIALQMVTEPTSLVNIRCSLCRSTFSTVHKLRLHVDSSDHQINQKISASFSSWQKSLETKNNFSEENIIAGFECKPCGSMFRRFIDVLDHFQNQRNNTHIAFFKKEVDINTMVKINYLPETETVKTPLDTSSEAMPTASDDTIDSSSSVTFRCYLCNDSVERADLTNHLKEMHKIQDNCVDQLIKLAEVAHSNRISLSENFQGNLKISSFPNDWCDCVIIRETDNAEHMVRCQQCGKCFATVAHLEEHRVQVQHGEITDSRGHLCYKKGCNQYFKSVALMVDHFYEIHAFQISEYKQLEPFKYVCNVCHLLAFSCPLKFSQHMTSHSRVADFDCPVCSATNDSRTSLRIHLNSAHVVDDDGSDDEGKKKEANNCPENNRPVNEVSSHPSPKILRGDFKSSFSSPESILNKENRNLLTQVQGYSEDFGQSALPIRVEPTPPFTSSWSSVASLIQSVGLENVKLVIETMINSKCEHSEKDSIVWKFAESIINVENIQETLVEKCRDCGKLFSCAVVLRKHSLLCKNASIECLNEFERIVVLCRDHLTRMMISFSNEPHRKPLFISVNSQPSEIKVEDSLVKSSKQCRPHVSGEGLFSAMSSKLASPGMMNFNRSILQPMLNPYRFSQAAHSFINIMPPLGMFPMPQFRFTGYNPPGSPANMDVMYGSKAPISTPSINASSLDSNKLQDPHVKSDNFNRKRTQIKNYQYEILRSFFNINNPPNDETIVEIIAKTGLDKKTVKHWFRNTLFKERQRCKDSPYNFSIPPETSLNLEEYEKTGKVEVKSECTQQSPPVFDKKDFDDDVTKVSRSGNGRPDDSDIDVTNNPKRIKLNQSSSEYQDKLEDCEKNFFEDLPSESRQTYLSSGTVHRRVANNGQSDDAPLDLSYQTTGYKLFNGSQSSLTLDPISPFESEQEPAENSNSICGERRHRTTLTAMQIQAMKSIFIHSRSPTHSELGALGSFLSLDMRVVQVWFQNQRAKLKKQERDMFYREKPIFPEAIPSIVDIPKSDRSHCLVCNLNLAQGVSKQSHLFSTGHLAMLMRCLLTKSHDMKISWKSVSEANSL